MSGQSMEVFVGELVDKAVACMAKDEKAGNILSADHMCAVPAKCMMPDAKCVLPDAKCCSAQ